MIPLFEHNLADRERVLGDDHPETLISCGNLAYAYHSADRLEEAIALFERTLADPYHSQGLPSRRSARSTSSASLMSVLSQPAVAQPAAGNVAALARRVNVASAGRTHGSGTVIITHTTFPPALRYAPQSLLKVSTRSSPRPPSSSTAIAAWRTGMAALASQT